MPRTTANRLLRAAESIAWAIQPEKLEAILELLELRAEGKSFSPAEVEARVGSQERPPERSGSGVAVLPVFGVIAHRMGSFEEISGGTSTEQLISRLDQMLGDERIGTLVLDVNSPGGTVHGVPEAAARIFEARGRKRIIAVANATMASAAYWLASAADEVVVTPSGEVGSIGVFAIHTEVSKQQEEIGIKRTIVRAGRFKADTNRYEPLSQEAREHLQLSVDDYYRLFVEAVAAHRGVSPDAVRGGFGEGRVLTAERAVAAGLADRVATLDQVLAELGVRSQPSRSSRADAEPVVPAAASAEGSEILSLVPIDISEPGIVQILRGGDADHDETHPVRIYVPEAAEAVADPAPDDHHADSVPRGADPVSDTSPTPTPHSGKEYDMPPQETTAPGGAANGNGTTATLGADALADERKRAADITALCHAHGMGDLASEFISQGFSADRAGREILQRKEQERPGSTLPKSKPPVELTESEDRQYSITRLMMAAAQGRPQEAGFEFEIHEELTRKTGHTPKGLMVPTNLGVKQQQYTREQLAAVDYRGALTTGTAQGGQELVFIEPGSFIDLLRSRMVLSAMGATFLPGLRGNVDFPKQTGPGEFSWVPESENITDPDNPADSDLDTGLVSLRPRNGRSITSFSRTLLAQGVINTEQLVRADLAAIGARGLDRAGVHGTGLNNQPTGIYAASGVHPVAFDGPISYAKVVEMETVIAEADGDIGRMGYVTTPGVRGAAKTTLTFPTAAAGQSIWTGGVRDGEMNGYRAMASTQVSRTLGTGNNEHGIVKGAWEHLLVGEWGAMDILVDPYTRGGKGLIRLILFVLADVALRYPEAFAKGTGLTVATDGS